MAYFSTEPASERRNVTGKNRVWDFFRLSNETHPANRLQPAQPRRKIRPTAMKAVSGIPYWPSRDPIGERGGVNLYGFCYNNSFGWYDYLGRDPKINILPRGDTSIPKGDKKRQEDLDKKANQLIAALNGYLKCCCHLYTIACFVTAEAVFQSQNPPTAPADNDYDRAHDKEVPLALGNRTGNNIPMTFTDATIDNGAAEGLASQDTGVLISTKAPVGVLAHELGHVAGYVGDNPKDPQHDIDPDPISFIKKNVSLMAPQGGDVPSRQWCSRVKGLAK